MTARIGRVFSSAAVADVVGEVRRGGFGPSSSPGHPAPPAGGHPHPAPGPAGPYPGYHYQHPSHHHHSAAADGSGYYSCFHYHSHGGATENHYHGDPYSGTQLTRLSPGSPSRVPSPSSPGPQTATIVVTQAGGASGTAGGVGGGGGRGGRASSSKRLHDRHLAQFVYSCSPTRGCNGYRY